MSRVQRRGGCLRWTPKMRQLAKVSPAPRKRDSAGAGHEAHTEEAQRNVQSEGGVGGGQGGPDDRLAGE